MSADGERQEALLVIEGNVPPASYPRQVNCMTFLTVAAAAALGLAFLPLAERLPWLDAKSAKMASIGAALIVLTTIAFWLCSRRETWSRVELHSDLIRVTRIEGKVDSVPWSDITGYSLAEDWVHVRTSYEPSPLAVDDLETALSEPPAVIACRTQSEEERLRLVALLDERGVPRLA